MTKLKTETVRFVVPVKISYEPRRGSRALVMVEARELMKTLPAVGGFGICGAYDVVPRSGRVARRPR